MTIKEYLDSIPAEHKKILTKLRTMIKKHDKSVKEYFGYSMKSQMIIFKHGDEFKYALASQKNHLSFHTMVMYCYPELREKYINTIKPAKFRSGCINFSKYDEFPYEAVEEMIVEMSKKSFPKE